MPHVHVLSGMHSDAGCCALQMLSQDLLQASLQIPFSVPPYMWVPGPLTHGILCLAEALYTVRGYICLADP